jgi:hypothetical protein
LFLQLLTVLAEKPPASAGYRGSDLVLWRRTYVPARLASGSYPGHSGKHMLAASLS